MKPVARAVLDYAVGFVLLVAGVGLLSSTTALGKAIGVLCAVVGVLMIVGRILAGRNA